MTPAPAAPGMRSAATAPPPAAPAPPAPRDVPRDTRRRRVIAWLAIGAFTALIGLAGALLSGIGGWVERDRLDPESAGPDGTAALVAVLRDHGVDVTVTRERTTTLDRLDDGPTTLVIPDSPFLTDDALAELFDAADHVVLIDPRARGVDLLLPGASAGGVAPAQAVAPACDVGAAVRAGDVVPGRVLESGSSNADGCYPVGDAYGLLVRMDADRSVAAFDGHGLLTNDSLAENGNAALALNLMGRLPNLAWYVPSPGDSDVSDEPSLGELTPGWVTPAVVLLVASALAAALWRGRRFGPLVAERLPVTARATETMEGRGRLYERGRDAVHAADALRLGTLERLRRALALPPAASAAHIADASAGLVGISPRDARRVLIEDEPATEADLLRLSDALRGLEDGVVAGIRGGMIPTQNQNDRGEDG